jgi:hypothetical protein
MKNEYMPFGSMCNSFGLINHGKVMSSEEFVSAMRIIMEYAQELEEPKQTINDIKRSEIQIPK